MKRWVPLVLLVAASGCSGTDTTELDGEYALVRLNGRPLPAPQAENSGCVFAVSQGALRFEEDLRFLWAQNLQALCGMGREMPPITSRMGGRYSLRGDTLLLRFEPDSTEAPTALRGRVSGDSIVLEPSPTYPLPRTYRKQEIAGE